MANLLWFIGAGASAPFGIPTMQKMVVEFGEGLKKSESSAEISLYDKIWRFLEANLGRQVDLEAVMTIVESIVNWSPDKLGIAALYHATGNLERQDPGQREVRVNPPEPETVETARKLQNRFEEYIKVKCEIPTTNVPKIEEAYGKLFDRIGVKFGGRNHFGHLASDWPIFTTNYDLTLERYWRDCLKTRLNTGFSYDEIAGCYLSTPDELLGGGSVRLFKLHGSVSWLMHPEYGLTEHRAKPEAMKTWTGTPFLGQVMLYPVVEKELYLEPYMTMYRQLGRELSGTNFWMVVGYSFGDRVVRDMFIRCSSVQKRMVILHPHANEVVKRLEGFKGKVVPINRRFADEHADDSYARCAQSLLHD